MKGLKFMPKQARLSKFVCFLTAVLLAGDPALFAASETASQYKKGESALYQDVFDQQFYYEGTQYLHLERLYRDLFQKKKRALNVNVFDEVPDSTFFTNRHARKALSEEELKEGPGSSPQLDTSEKWTITKGKFNGITPGFFIRDKEGVRYLLKFDPMDYLGLGTGAEVAASRFMHALGYNVPYYSIVRFKKDQLEIDPAATIYDESGFRKKLTPEKLEEFLLFAPEREDGSYQVSASRILEGEVLGPMPFQGRRRNDPEDPVNHEDRREIRALQIFSAWLGNYDTRTSNSLDVVEETEKGTQIRHYLIDFNSAFGSTPRGPKTPEMGHEHMIDYEEIFKAFITFGFWKKPWQKRWEEAGKVIENPSYGYFDNRYFDPGRYKIQLPYFPFKDLTRADGFWAAKIIMTFTDKDIAALVSTGEFSDKETEKMLVETLTQRRDLIARYWFGESCPLDDFSLSTGQTGGMELTFNDLAVHYGFEKEGARTYRFDVIGKRGNRGVRLAGREFQEGPVSLSSEWLNRYRALDVLIRVKQGEDQRWSPFVRVEITSEAGSSRISGILHQD